MGPAASHDVQLLRDLDRLTGAACAVCGRRLCGHEALFSVALGFKEAARCLGCLARGLERRPAELRDHLARHFRHRDCYRRAWEVACDQEGFAPTFRPACLWSSDEPVAPLGEGPVPEAAAVPTEMAEWDAGDMGCGDLVLALRGRLNALPPAAVLKVTARDPAAPEDLPAWCRLTGHRLLRAEPPDFYIQRKES